MTRVSTVRLLELGAGLSEREREVVRAVDRFRLMSHAQLAAILMDSSSEASPISAARIARRILARLTDDKVLARLSRRVGGLRAGSAGYVYYLGPAGQRLVAYWEGRGLTRGRFRPEPGGRFVRHRLAVSELYIDAIANEARGALDLLDFEPEPDCWRSFVDAHGGKTIVKPDAFLRIGVGAYEDRYFVEVDLGTESRAVVARKLQTYWRYFLSGTEQAEHDVFPRVLILTNTDQRYRALVNLCGGLDPDAWRLFEVGRLEDGVAQMAETDQPDIDGGPV